MCAIFCIAFLSNSRPLSTSRGTKAGRLLCCQVWLGMFALGVGLGVVCHVVLATLGLGALIALHPGALSAIRSA